MVDENQLKFANSIVVKIVDYSPNHKKSVKIVASQDLLH